VQAIEETIHEVLQELQAGAAPSTLAQRYQLDEFTVTKWRHLYSGLSLDDLRHLVSLNRIRSQP
jgi:hypothetical protein